jgi:hypothetical protein
MIYTGRLYEFLIRELEETLNEDSKYSLKDYKEAAYFNIGLCH